MIGVQGVPASLRGTWPAETWPFYASQLEVCALHLRDRELATFLLFLRSFWLIISSFPGSLMQLFMPEKQANAKPTATFEVDIASSNK